MEPRVFLNMQGLIVDLEMLLCALHTALQFFDQLRRDLCDRNYIDLKGFTQVVEIFHFLDRESPQIGAPSRLNSNQALVLQAVECLPDGRLTDSKLLRQRLLRQPDVVAEFTFQNALLDALVGESGQILWSG